MSADRLPDGDFVPESERLPDLNRRIIALVLLAILLFLGAGVGTIAFIGPDDSAPGVATETPAPGPSPSPNATANVSLGITDNAELLTLDNVMPGSDGSGSVVLRNVGEDPGRLVVTDVTVEQGENGAVGPEASVDDSPGEGELASALEVRLAVRRDGESVPVSGAAGTFGPLSALRSNVTLLDRLNATEQATVVLEWRLPADVGNEIQSDSIQFTVQFTLRALGR